MKMLFIFLLFIQQTTLGQHKIKKVLIEGEGAPIVMISGGVADMSVFTAHSNELSRNYKVIRMEKFNVQYATEGLVLPKDYSVQKESEAIKFTLDSLGIKEGVILVGHSYGGVIAFDFAVHYPEYIRSLVLVEPPLFNMAEQKKESPEGMKKIRKLMKQFTPEAEITEEMVRQFRCDLMNCDSLDIRKNPLWATWVQQKNRMRGLSLLNSYKVDLKKVHQFQKPVLIVTGTQTVAFHARINELLTAEFPLSNRAAIQGGHTAINTNPKEFIEVLLNFLK